MASRPEGLLPVEQEPFLRNAKEADVREGVGKEKAEAFASRAAAGAADGETSDEWRVTIGPMEIKTYRLEYAPDTLPGR